MKRYGEIIVGLALAAALLGGCGQTGEAAEVKANVTEASSEAEASATEGSTEAGSDKAEVSPDALFGEFETVTLEGDEADESIFAEAGLTMVNIWGTFCGPCIQEMPELAELAEEYAEKDVQLVGMIIDVSEAKNEAAETIVEYTGATYTHLVLSADLAAGYLRGVQAVPTTVFVDSTGEQVGEEYLGARSKEAWSEIIDELLEEMAE